jgi:ABC-2 type transport system permease protein
MLTRIFRHDLRLLIADRTLIVFAVLFALLIAYAISSGVTWAHKRAELARQWYEDGLTALASARQQVADIEQGKQPASAAPFAGWVFTVKLPAAMPPAPLAPLSVGQADLYPFATTIDIYTTKDALFKNYETDNPTTLLAGRFDPAFVIIYLYPLLIIALAYNLLAQEREEGTLALTLAQPVRLRDVICGKVAARLSITLTLVIGLTLISLAVSGVNFAAPGAAQRLAWWLLLVIAYTLFWFVITMWADARGRSSAANATVLVGVWLLLVVIAPSLLSIVVTSLYPAPSRLDFIQRMRRNDNEVSRLGERVLAQYHGDHPELAPPGKLDWNDLQSRFFVVGQEKEGRTLPLIKAYDEQLARQQMLVDRLRFLSPAVVMQEAMNALAGADRARYQHFRAQVEAYLDEWHAYSAPRSFRQIKLRSSDYDALPRFNFREESDMRVTRRAFAGLLGLLLPAVAIGWLTLRALRRYPLVG